MTKRILAMLLVLALVLSMVPMVVLAEGAEVTKSPKAGTHTDAGHAGDCGVTSGWQAWESDNSLPTAGNWYLTKDIHITTGDNTTGDLNLCLNGFVIYKTGTGRIYGTKSGAANTMTVCDCTAYEEDGVYYAGALTGGKMTSQDGGAAIFVRRQGVLKIYDGRFIGNAYQNDTDITGGGVIMLQGVSSGKFATAHIYGGEFAGNKSLKKNGTTPNNGGVIGSGGNAVLEISGGRFHDNLGANGGVIRMGDAGKLTIKGGKFYNNEGTSGGVAQFNTGSTVTITGGEFTGNRAKDGGVLYGASSTVTITGATFTGNSSTFSGSVLHNNGAMALTIGEGTVITGNIGTDKSAAEGYSAAVSMCGSNGKLTLSGKVVIANNTTGATGVASLNFNKAASDTLYVNELAAGSYVEFSTPKTVPASAGEVIALNGTQSSWNNGWVAHMGTDGQLQAIGYENGAFVFSTVHAHTLCSDAGCTEHTDRVVYEAWGDDAEEKGKLPSSGNWYLVDDVTVTSEVKIAEATTLNLCLNGKTVTGFAGSNGRAYSTTADTKTTINICDCSAQTVDGIYKAGKFTGFTNKSTGSGGAVIFIRAGSELNIFDGIITGNTTLTGGTVYIKNSTFHMWNGEISNNFAQNGTTMKNGGGVYLDNSTMTLHDGKISGNHADQGGGIYMGGTNTLIMENGSITNNEASWGGAIAYSGGNNTADLRGGSITGNTAKSNGGAIQAAYGTAVTKVSGNVTITGNTLSNGDANNIRLGNSGYITVGTLDTNARIGITAGVGRVFSANVLGSDLSSCFLSDDATQVVFLNADNKLQLKDKPAEPQPPVDEHKHTLCNDTGCTEHTDEVVYKAWESEDSLPTEGNWYLTKDVKVTEEVNLKTAITLNLCLNGHKVTGVKGSNIRAYSTTNNVASTIQISDCTGSGKFHDFCSTSTGSGGGVVFVRPGSTLKVFDVTFENNVSYCIGGAIATTGTTYLYNCNFNGNQSYKVASGTTTYTNGGAIYVNVYNDTVFGELYAYNCTFKDNMGMDGGAIYASTGTTVYVENTTFTGNEAVDEGGVYRCANGNTTLKNVTITDNNAKYGSAVCVYGGNVMLENVEITGNHNAGGFGAFHMNRNNAGADPITVTLKGKVIIDGNTSGTDNVPQNLFMREHEAFVDATGLTAGSKIGVTMHPDRIAKGLMNITTGQNGIDNTAYFASDDSAAWIVAMGQEVYLKTAFDHTHCICGKSDCTDATHEKISFNAWSDTTKLPSSGNYCLMADMTITKETEVTGTLNLCLNGHKVTGGEDKGLRFLSTLSTSSGVLNITDCTAKWEDGVYTAGGFFDNTNTHTGSGGGAIFIRKGGHLNFYEGIVSGNVSATGGAAFYVKEATANFYGGLVKDNKATYDGAWYNGGAIYCDNAVAVTIYGTTFTGNEAGYGGAIHCAGTSTLEICGGKITGNTAHSNGGAVNATAANATLKLSGEPIVTGNKLENGTANNIRLGNTGVMQVADIGENALVGVTSGMLRAISTQTQDFAKNFVSDDPKMAVVYLDGVLYMDAAGNHKHCLCGGTSQYGCNHGKLTYAEWNDPTSLPASGNYYLSVDVVLDEKQHRVENATLNLCLNGHTVSVGENNENGRMVYMTNGGKLSISDCTGTGKITGAKQGAILTNANGKNMELNLYGGTFTGNHSRVSGGAIVIQGECTFNMYGGKLTDNSANSSLKTDTDGKVILDTDGNQTYNNANAGALYVGGGAVFNMYDGEISGNKAVAVAYMKANETKATKVGGNGGGVYIGTGCTANLYGGKISENECDLVGGGFYVAGAGAVVNLLGTEISGNKAENGGGGISQTNSAINMSAGKVCGNTAADGGAGLYISTGTTFKMTGGEIFGNAALNAGGVYVLKSTAAFEGGKIIGNKATGKGGGIYAGGESVNVSIAGTPVITGNTLNGKANNLELGSKNLMTVGTLTDGAQVGVSATVFRAISEKTSDYTKYVFSDNAKYEVIYKDEALYLTAGGNHKHCLCTGTSAEGCSHEGILFAEWDDPNSLPTSGSYFLSVDVTVSAQHRVEKGALNLCLNGHTIRVGQQGGRVFYMTNGGKLNISDCDGNGKISGATAAAILTNAEGKDMELNLYGGNFTDNHSKGSGGAIVIQGDCTFNMYGGAITGNSVESYLKTDESGNVILDKNGNQAYYASNGGGLYVANGVFNMYGGQISKNEAKRVEYLKAGATTGTIVGGQGGAMQITYGATANFYGGKVSENIADNGGGIFATATDTVINLMGTEISGNTARNGAGVLIQTHALLNMKDGKVTGNIATASGAGIYVSTGTTMVMTGGEVVGNHAVDGKTDKNGGGIYVLSSTLELAGGKIHGNKGASGAGIYSSAVMSGDTPRAATIYMKDGALITDNHASENGGAIMMSGLAAMTSGEGSKIIMEGGEISKNTAKNAGGILVQTKAALELSGGKITGNQARDGGGGVYISTGTKLTMTGGSITGNNAKNGGGGIFLLRSTAVIKNGSVSYNTAGNGGGIKNNGAKLDVYSLNIVGNDAVGTTSAAGKYTSGNAGGLWAGRAGYKKNGVQMYDTPEINIYNIYLADNTATGPAGGVLIQSENTIFNMYGGTIAGNATEDSTGGGLYLSTNVKATITGGTFADNKAKTSAAIHITGNSPTISGVKFHGNQASTTAGAITITGKTTVVTMKDVEFYDNTSGGHVGALVVQGYATLNLENAKFHNNVAGNAGGAVYFSNPGYGNFKNVEIYENEAAKQAGGIFVGPASRVKFEDVTIRDNVANTEGGAIYNRGRLEMKNCKLLNNTAEDGNGGGISTFKTSSYIMGDDVGVFAESCVISGNKASMQGGGIYGHRACPIYLTDCVITDNVSGLEGGAIYSDGRMGLTGVTATGNVSSGEGYAIYLTPSQFDGHSYQTGHKRIGGEMIVKDNQGGDMYLSKGTALAVTGESLGEKSYVGITIYEGVLSQWVFGVYNYEGGNQVYVITAGDRSITDPEDYEVAQPETEPQPEETTGATAGTETEQTAEGADDTMLYAGIGGIAVLLIAAAAVVIVKKKKAGKAAGSTTKE